MRRCACMPCVPFDLKHVACILVSIHPSIHTYINACMHAHLCMQIYACIDVDAQNTLHSTHEKAYTKEYTPNKPNSKPRSTRQTFAKATQATQEQHTLSLRPNFDMSSATISPLFIRHCRYLYARVCVCVCVCVCVTERDRVLRSILPLFPRHCRYLEAGQADRWLAHADAAGRWRGGIRTLSSPRGRQHARLPPVSGKPCTFP